MLKVTSLNDSSSLSTALETTKKEQNRIINDLISYIEHSTNCEAEEDERNINLNG